MLRTLQLVIAHDLLEYRYMDDVTGNVFSLFCSTWRAILKMFVRLTWIQASESLEKKISKSYLHYLYYKEKKWRKGDKKSSLQLKNA